MEPPQKKYRTSGFPHTAEQIQVNPLIPGMRPPMLPQTPQTARALEVAAKLSQSLIGAGNNYPMGAQMSGTMLSGLGFDTKDEFQVPSDKVGLLIGKGGSKIKEIQQTSGARMDIAKVSDPLTPHLRNVTLGGSPQSVASARNMINAIVNELPRGARNGIQFAPSNPKKTIQILSSSVGLVIGKGGGNIRKIIQDTGSTIHIEKPGEAEMTGRKAPPAGYQNVYLKGSDEAVIRAEQAILELVNGDLQRKKLRIAQPPAYAQYGQQQFVIPQYQQAYGFQAFAPQQIIGFQQPYAVPGQPVMQPTYGVMPGYPSQACLQAPPQPGTIGLAQYGTGNTQAPYPAPPVYQHPTILSNSTNGSPVVVQPQFMNPHQFRSSDSTQQKPPPQPGFPQQQLGSAPMVQDKRMGQFGAMQGPPGSNMVYSLQVGGGPTGPPPTSFLPPPNQSVLSAKGPPGVNPNQQFTQLNGKVNVNKQLNPPGRGPNTQLPPDMRPYAPPTMPYNPQGVITSNAQTQQVGQTNSEQNLIPPVSNVQ